jgi:glycosyltransferase involved in cell wall biosynthesis
MKVFGLTSGTGSRFYRMIPQFKFLKKKGHEVIIKKFEKDGNDDNEFKWADVIILEMIWSPQLMKYIKKLNPKAKIIMECDDLIHIVPPLHYAYAETKGWGKYKWFYRIAQTLKYADALIVTNDTLKKEYGWLCKKCLVFDNFVDIEHWLRPYSPNTGDQIRMLWAGSTSHTGDLLFIKPVIDRILKKYKGRIKFIYIGTGGIKSDDLYAKFVYGEDLFEVLPPNREALLPVPAELWPHILATLHADLAIAPLENNKFNKAKSQCKWLEYSINKIPAVYSKWFYDKVEECKTGLLADTQEEWYEQICLLIEDIELRKQIGQNAYDEVYYKHNVDKNIDKFINFIENL